MYEATDDPYCYSGTGILKNRLDLRTQAELDAFEAAITTQRADEPLPAGQLDADHYRAIHRHLFQDVYDWAGDIRTVRITKGSSAFCFPENIETQMRRVFGDLARENQFGGLDSASFAAKAAHFLAELNAIHPFREGNGRTQNVFLGVLADQAGHPLDFQRLNPPDMMQAMIASFEGDEGPLRGLILRLMRDR
jgi:cell filamentation protein